jgi:hypothetical protein
MNPPIQVAQIRPDRIVVYNEFEYASTKRGKNINSLANLSKQKYKGDLSKEAKKRMETAIVQWSSTLQNLNSEQLKDLTGYSKKLVLVTLTLPSTQAHTDNYIKRYLLNHFLIKASRIWNAKRYIWKAEFQQNDNIHFHILFDKFIPLADLRSTWNNILANHGYIDAFETKHSHRNPNTTDIHQIRDKSRTLFYMKKYMSKVEVCRLEGGKAWGCSDCIGKLKAMVDCIDNEINCLIEGITNSEGARFFKKDEVFGVYGDVVKIMKELTPSIYERYKEHLVSNWEYANLMIDRCTRVEIEAPF